MSDIEYDNLPFFNVIIAMDENRGIGWRNSLPWPFIKTDYEHYTGLSRTPTIEGKKVINIIGRKTYECATPEKMEKTKDRLIKIVLSRTLTQCPSYVSYVAKDFDDALKYASCDKVHQEAEDIWVLGGQPVLEEALKSPWCKRVYLTRIEGEYECDAYMPKFEMNFRKIRDPRIREEPVEENGVRYKFEVYEPKHSQ